MLIQEQCTGWSMDLKIQRFDMTEEQETAVRFLLHTVGDAIGIISSLNDPLRTRVSNMFGWITTETKDRYDSAFRELLDSHVSRLSLTDEYSHESLFGHDLIEALNNQLKNETEISIVQGILLPPEPYFPTEEEEPEEYGIDDDEELEF